MAKLVVKTPAPDFMWWPSALENDGPGDIVSVSSTTLKFLSNTGYMVTLAGSGFSVVGDAATAGTVTQVTVRDATDTTTVMTINDLDTKLTNLFDLLFGEDGGAGPDPFAALSLLMKGRDIITGSIGSDQLGFWSPGADIVKGQGGHDFLAGDSGNDKLDGGPGFDTLSYYGTVYDTTSFRGINLDAAKGVVTDAWGDRDLIRNFESFEGSEHADVIKGTANGWFYAEEFRGLSGNDVINGRGGFDRIVHTFDVNYGGGAGINADLAAGRVRDGWGDTDRVSNVESVFGTAFDDTFKGDGRTNEFQGLAGVDLFRGGGGSDWLNFWLNDSNGGMNGIEVDLSKTDHQVVDDGYGNTETATSFENVVGTGFGDKITGNAAANSLYGSGGDDSLSGKGGRDYIDAGDGDDLVSGGKQGDMLIGGKGTDTVSYADAASGVNVNLGRGLASGGAGADQLKSFENVIGSDYNDVPKGVRGGSVFNGGAGDDVLIADDSYIVVDRFVFDDPAFSVDDIRGFDVFTDRIQLDGNVFTALSPGTLDLAQFVEGAAALDADDHVIYDPTSGNLYYDPDGAGGTDQIQFAHLKGGGAGAVWSCQFEVIA